ncbi:MAG TPA: hypothetical protein VMU31_07530 [Rhizomicrobium sp.]|nr:hypothetical protein [Rhizomicrobium sp.]
MRIPRRIIEHPFEAAIAGLLLLGLLFGSADFTPNAKAPLKTLRAPPNATAQKM